MSNYLHSVFTSVLKINNRNKKTRFIYLVSKQPHKSLALNKTQFLRTPAERAESLYLELHQ